MRKLILASCAALALSGGCGDPEAEPFRPGSAAVTVTNKVAGRSMNNATFHSGEQVIGTLPPGVKATVRFDPAYKAKRKVDPNRQVQITVNSGAFKGKTGFVPRPHLNHAKKEPAAKSKAAGTPRP